MRGAMVWRQGFGRVAAAVAALALLGLAAGGALAQSATVAQPPVAPTADPPPAAPPNGATPPGALFPRGPAGPGAATARQAEPPPAADLREEVRRIPVTVTLADGRRVTRPIPLTLYRPAGDGPFPLAVVNHGRAIGEARREPARQRYETLARYLVSKGFAVVVPTRLGYGETYGELDPESAGGCAQMRVEPGLVAAGDQVLAAVAHAASQPGIDASRWVAIGQSVGGLVTASLAWRQPPGLVAAINFAGGAGGNPTRRPGDPCTPESIEALYAARASASAVPMLWLYWENDLFWGPELPRRWAAAWRQAGGRLAFHQLAAVGDDGHSGLTRDMDHWVPLVEDFLREHGHGRTGTIRRPPPSGYAALDDVSRVPAAPATREEVYGRFLAAKPPRAFAVGPTGASGWATGDWAMGRALGFCQARRGLPCKLYAVDDDVVWTP
jgi:dienelactone hydrolase